jgi:hypothetical protein
MSMRACLVVLPLAGAIGGTSVDSADLRAKSAVPIDYVRVCPGMAGFFAIPGTETCLKVGGRVRFESRYLEPGSRDDDVISTRARGRIELDARTVTDYGMLRAFVRYEVTRNTGTYGSSTFNLDRAFVNFGGLTAGRVSSYFDFYTNDYNYGTIFVSDTSINAFAYTLKFGSGFSATVSLEDPIERRLYNFPNGPDFPGYPLTRAGSIMPDVVGQLLLEQEWGKAQVSLALRQIRSEDLFPGFPFNEFPDTEYGYAVQGGLQVKLPMIAEGDQLWLQGGYSRGALTYLGFGNTSSGDISLNQTDVFVNRFGDLELAQGWTATALFLHYWTPQWRSAAFGSYGAINYHDGAVFPAPAGGSFGFIDTKDWRVGANLAWVPISGFYIGVEGIYRRVDPRGRVYVRNDASARLVSSADAWEGRLRVQRDF